MAFELFASGKYPNVASLRQTLTDVGLRMPRTNNPISDQTLYKLLRDPYYKGTVVYKGIEYTNGRHPRLIEDQLFDRVQRVFAAHSGIGSRQRTHNHYLKGWLWCSRCRQRFTIQRSKGRHGGVFYYFFCIGRQDGMCDQPYIAVEAAEEAVADHYGRAVRLSAEELASVRALVDAAVTDHQELTEEVRGQLAQRLSKLGKKESTS
jgi:hypothetical protein